MVEFFIIVEALFMFWYLILVDKFLFSFGCAKICRYMYLNYSIPYVKVTETLQYFMFIFLLYLYKTSTARHQNS